MAFIHPKSEAMTTIPALDLFSLPPTQTCVDNSYIEEYQPTQQLADDVTIEFRIPGSGNAMVDLLATRALIEGKIVKVPGDSNIKSPKQPKTAEELRAKIKSVLEKKAALATAEATTAEKAKELEEAASEDARKIARTALATAKTAENTARSNVASETAEADEDDVGFVNGPFSALFSNVKVDFNHTQVSSIPGEYPYVADMMRNVGFGPAAENSHLQTQLFKKDTPGYMEEISALNAGMQWRKQFTDDSSTVQMFGPLAVDVFNTARYLLNEVSICIKFIPSKSCFYLMASKEGYKFKITKFVIFIRRVDITSTEMLKIHKELAETPARYPYKRWELKKFSIGGDQVTKTADHLFVGAQPTRAIIAFVEESAYSGNIKKNPFNYQTFDIIKLCITSGGQQFPSNGFQPDFDNKGNSIRCYESIFSGMGIYNGDDGVTITRLSFGQGYAFFCFDFTPDQSASTGTHWNNTRLGNFRVDVQLKQPTRKEVLCLILAEFDALMQIDFLRKVSISS
jgi:hypothetical protein